MGYICEILCKLPSPLEVDRLISQHSHQSLSHALCYRPLLRWIGLYLRSVSVKKTVTPLFPSHLEVNRFISNLMNNVCMSGRLFPSPLEVHRFISHDKSASIIKSRNGSPSPREVYRFISQVCSSSLSHRMCFRPLSR